MNLKWITESNRPDHVLGGVVTAMLLTIVFTAGCALGMEFKDRQHGGEWDWKDIAATMIGGLVGQAVQVIMIMMIKQWTDCMSFWPSLALVLFCCCVVAAVCVMFLKRLHTILS